MRGLIKKDLFIIKNNLRTLLIMFAIFAIILTNGNSNIGFIATFLSISIMMSTFSYDEYNKFDAFAVTLPNGRKNIVASKYLATILIIVISTLLMSILTILMGIVRNNLNIEEIISSGFGCLISVFIVQSIIYPIIFKFGIEKSRIGLFVGIFLVAGIFALISKLGIHLSDSTLSILNNYGLIIFSISSVVIMVLSYLVSKHIYLKKEF